MSKSKAISYSVAQTVLFVAAIVLGLAATLATALALADLFGSGHAVKFATKEAIGVMANEIQNVRHELEIIRSLLVAIVLWFLVASVAAVSKKLGDQKPA